jgi:hypothetical protein
VKKNLLTLLSFCLSVVSASAQGTYVNVIVNGLDPSCGILTVNGSFFTGNDTTNVANVTFQMAGALNVYGGMVPTTSNETNLTICVQPSPNCGFINCVSQVIYANTMNTVLINMGGMNDADQDGFTSEIDCDDNNPFVNPAMDEICNDFTDNNCDGAMDEGCNSNTDYDNDGFPFNIDCDDLNAGIYPGAEELCGDSIDNNCNILIDENCNGGFVDADMDGFDSTADCNDNDSMINPYMPELCGDMTDNNCDGTVDEEGCIGNPFDCSPDISLITDSTSFNNEPGTVWILNNLPLVGVYSYFWDFGDGNTSTSPFPSNYYETDGTYTVCLTMMGNGCTGTTCLTFTVTPTGGFIPGGMPMTGFSLNVINATPSEVQEVSADVVLEAYPCPFNEELNLNIQSSIAGNASISCYDMTGALIANERIAVSNQPNIHTIQTDSWSSGAYTILVTTPSGTSRRVVIK